MKKAQAMKLLTKRKLKWRNQFKPDILRGAPLNPNIAVANRYYEKLAKLIRHMSDETEKELRRLFAEPHATEFFAQDASISSQARILTNALMEKFNKLFASLSKTMAEQVANESDKASAASVRTSLKELSGGLTLPQSALQSGDLNEILNATVTENVALIKSISQKYMNSVQQAVMRSITTGNGLQELIPYLESYKGITLRRAHFIALDQTRKAYAGLNKQRMINAGIRKAEWLHSGGSNHPRKTHIRMSGEIFNLDEGLYDADVKKKIQPGQLPGCRCRMVPVISFNDEE
ncbi:MAG: hypothetical protein KGL39_23635 [Patescibacteria group bacterium]|nr:hypothetical protein [Patescibacteria group bacterium]